ncbi:ttc30a [Symbiodinium necroappetens]|uniref:Ttc30a protein n=1 Tax=Symbiodinium necroappetens TaxID=1628268 RepID=A0A813BKS8_9DINO|nr:ttc30a [Symbiodinium necroappetens]
MSVISKFEPLVDITIFLNRPTDVRDLKELVNRRIKETSDQRTRLMQLAMPTPPGMVRTDMIPIRLEGLSYKPGASGELFHNVDLSVEQGKLVALQGEHRSGKTKLIRLMAGGITPTTGKVIMPSHLRCLLVTHQVLLMDASPLQNLFFGDPLAVANPEERHRALWILDKLRMMRTREVAEQEIEILQEPLSDEEQVDPGCCSKSGKVEPLPAHAQWLPPDGSRRAQELQLELRGWQDSLSFQEKAKLHIARALIVNPEILILEKPLMNFDERESQLVQGVLREYVSNRGVALSADSRDSRRPRTCFYTAEREDASQTDVVWKCGAGTVVAEKPWAQAQTPKKGEKQMSSPKSSQSVKTAECPRRKGGSDSKEEREKSVTLSYSETAEEEQSISIIRTVSSGTAARLLDELEDERRRGDGNEGLEGLDEGSTSERSTVSEAEAAPGIGVQEAASGISQADPPTDQEMPGTMDSDSRPSCMWSGPPSVPPPLPKRSSPLAPIGTAVADAPDESSMWRPQTFESPLVQRAATGGCSVYRTPSLPSRLEPASPAPSVLTSPGIGEALPYSMGRRRVGSHDMSSSSLFTRQMSIESYSTEREPSSSATPAALFPSTPDFCPSPAGSFMLPPLQPVPPASYPVGLRDPLPAPALRAEVSPLCPGAGMMRVQVKEGEMTKTIYTHIMEQKYDKAVKILNQQLQFFPESRCALSLLGYCYYHMQDFASAADIYGQLVQVVPEIDEYKIYHVQSLIKAGLYEEASQACTSVESPEYTERVLMLQATISYEQEETQLARSILDQCHPDSEERQVFEGALLWKEKRYAEAMKLFNDAITSTGYQASLAYNIALCYYSSKQYGPALKHIAEIIERGVRDHPELSVGALSEGDLKARSVGNTSVLRETALIEAFNLKSAIEYMTKNMEAAKDALADMPPRDESELDPVTLHNQALIEMDEKPTEGFRKLNFLLNQQPSPPETFVNLLLLYCKYSYYDLAADILAENAELTYKNMKPEDYEFLDALILGQSSPEEAYRRFDELSAKHVEMLRKGTKNIQDARRQRDQTQVKKYLAEFDDALAKYIPVLMGQAKIYWELENYSMVEKIFRQSAEFCSEDESWKLNVAHIFFMQEKFKECIRYYEPFVRKHNDDLLNVTAIILANLCVAYVMTSANEEAEELMRLVEREEEKVKDPSKPVYHLCIINLVIGTLYCTKGNFEFGISRIIKSLEPYDKKIGVDTWYYAKRCMLALAETLAKNMVVLNDEVFDDIIAFLDSADQVGKNIGTTINVVEAANEDAASKRTVSQEARMIKRFFLKLRGHRRPLRLGYFRFHPQIRKANEADEGRAPEPCQVIYVPVFMPHRCRICGHECQLSEMPQELPRPSTNPTFGSWLPSILPSTSRYWMLGRAAAAILPPSAPTRPIAEPVPLIVRHIEDPSAKILQTPIGDGLLNRISPVSDALVPLCPLQCARPPHKHRKTQGLEERWWLEYDPPKANYKSGFGRGPFGGNSIPKQNWPRQMVPIELKKKWEKRERLRYAFRKHGFELDVPKLGG